MKNYYLILIENFIGIGYLILFLIGFFTNNANFYNIGGIGMLIFMFIMIKGSTKNLTTFIFACGIGALIAYFVSKWWIGVFWVSAFFTAGQILSIGAIIKAKDQIENMNLVNYAMSGMDSNSDKIQITEILFFIVLIVGPYFLANYLN